MTSSFVKTYRDLIVWQRAMELATAVYDLTLQFPSEELYGLSAEMRKVACAIPSRIAAGKAKATKTGYLYYLRAAYVLGTELETQLELSKQLYITGGLDFSIAERPLSEVMKMLSALIRTLSIKPRKDEQEHQAQPAEVTDIRTPVIV
ncbi:MAG: four helix bundle protein [bacterium]|nr:four helix bundle protein [bacterium]